MSYEEINMHLTIDQSNAEMYCGGFAREGTPHAPDSAFFIRPFELKAGQEHKGHSHFIDHVGNLVSGQARVEWRREDGTAEGTIDMLIPSKILIRADTWHRIVALTDITWECWFSRADADKLTDDEGRRQWFLEKHNG